MKRGLMADKKLDYAPLFICALCIDDLLAKNIAEAAQRCKTKKNQKL